MRRREKVAADPFSLEDALSDRLASVDEIQDAVLAADRADLLDRLHEARVRRDVCHRDQPRTSFPDDHLELGDVDAALRQVGRMDDLDAETPMQRQEGDLIRDVVVARRDEHVSGFERDRRERPAVCIGRVRRVRDVLRTAAEQLRRHVVEGRDRVAARGRGFVAPDLSFQTQVRLGGLEDRRRHQCRAGVVEVDEPSAAWCVGTESLELLCAERVGQTVRRHS